MDDLGETRVRDADVPGESRLRDAERLEELAKQDGPRVGRSPMGMIVDDLDVDRAELGRSAGR